MCVIMKRKILGKLQVGNENMILMLKLLSGQIFYVFIQFNFQCLIVNEETNLICWDSS